MNTPAAKLSANNLKKRYKARTVVEDVSFEVKSGEVVGLLGPNGAGKTTCFYMIVGLVAADAGEVYIDDNRLTHQPMHTRARLGLSYLPQEASVFRKLNVEENIRAVLELQKLPEAELNDRLEGLLKELHVDHVRHVNAAALSGGERRRVEIARALAGKPRMILLDEPSMGLAPLLVKEIFSIIKEINQAGTTILLVEQNAHMALSIAHRAYVLETGRITLTGPAAELAQSEEIRKAYLGG